MSVKISELTASAGLSSTDIIPVVDVSDVQTQKATLQQVLEYVTGSMFNSLIVTELTAASVQLTGNFSGSFYGNGSALTDIPNSSLVNSSLTVGSTTISFGDTATIIEGISVLTGSTITGSTALFETITASNLNVSGNLIIYQTASLGENAYVLYNSIYDKLVLFPGLYVSGNLTGSGNAKFNEISGTTVEFTIVTASHQLISGDLRVLGTASVGQLNTITQQSLLVGDKYITILSGGVDHTGINGSGFLWGTSSGPGETTGTLGEHAHVLYDASRDALEIFPGLYVTGSTTVFGISGTTAQFTTISASIISASSYIGLPASSGSGTPGGTNTEIQFNSGSTFSGSPNLIYNYITNTLSGTTAEFTTVTGSAAYFSGNVGIGTTNPSYPLDVNGAGAFKDYLLIEASSGAGNDSLLIFNARTNGNSNTNVARFVADAINNTTDAIFKLQMIDADGGGWDDGFVFKASPAGDDYTYVGLGTNLPSVRLDVVGDNTTAARFSSGSVIISGNLSVTENTTLSTISGTTAQFAAISSSVGLIQGDLRVLGTASIAQLNTLNQTSLVIGDKYITLLSGATDHPSLDGSGLLWGSGSTGPTVNELGANAHVRYRSSTDVLEIFPGLYVAGDTSISGNLVVTGSITELSTRKIKTNIQTVNNQLTTISKLNPVSYTRLDDGRKEYGFISEEVKQVYPEFVVGEGINYPKMVSVLVSAVKELTEKVEKQQNEIHILKGKV